MLFRSKHRLPGLRQAEIALNKRTLYEPVFGEIDMREVEMTEDAALIIRFFKGCLSTEIRIRDVFTHEQLVIAFVSALKEAIQQAVL